MSAYDRATFAARWRQAVAAAPDRLFLRWEGQEGTATDWTYAQFDELVAAVAGGLIQRGVEAGDGVHLAMPNAPAFVAVWLATVRLGGWIVPSDPGSTARELREHLARTKPKLGVCERQRATTYAQAAAGDVGHVSVDVDDTELSDLRGQPLDQAQVLAATPQQRAAVMFTSGTTAAPKGVVVTQANYAFAGDIMAAASGLAEHDRQIVVLPLFHANAQYYSFAAAISVGASVVLMPRFSARGFLQQAARHQATHASLFASPMRMILARGATPVPGLRLRHVWYAQNITTEQYERLAALFGCRPRQLYGMTETIPAVLTNRRTDTVIAALGTPTLGCEVDVFAADAPQPVPDGETGEIVVRGTPGITLFAGYLDDPATTSGAFDDGWFRTGDRAWRDADGRCYFAGRGDDMLKVSGENVSVVEIEAVVASHPDVLEVAVIGQPDLVRDEVPVAYVVPRTPGQALRLGEVAAYCADRLAPVKRPRQYHVVDDLPRTSVGKIRKFLLRPQPESDRRMEAKP